MAASKQWTEHDIFMLIKRRYTQDGGNGPAAVVVPGVRSDAGFDARRTIDAVAMNLWPSRGLSLTGFEIKCSRSDWTRELKNPAKADEIAGLVDFFFLVVADETIVHEGELPEGWGLLVQKGGKLSQVTDATALHDLTPVKRKRPLPEGFHRGFLASLLRQAARQGSATPEAIKDAVDKAVAAEREHDQAMADLWKGRAEEAEAAIRTFNHETGLALTSKGWGMDPKELGRAVKLVLSGDGRVEAIENRLKLLGKTCDGIKVEIEQHIKNYEDDKGAI